ncbi:MAG TPA: MG2 domain-containing protein [Bacteroidia bacterium]|nr:MG2 domain-containing protein [Bacteroidia bacterium]
MITIRAGTDFNYMSFNDSRVEDSRFDVGGKTDNLSGYEAFIYGDREIYRPGEKVNFNTIIRTSRMENLSQVPVKIKILMPNGREYMNLKKILNTQGASEGSFTLNVAAVTGSWSIELYSSNDILLASKFFSVEEFIPDRISVEVKSERSGYTSGDSVLSEITAKNLFGTPASNRNYEMDFSLRKKVLYSKKFNDYNFNISGAENISFNNILRQGKTGESGNAKEYFHLDEGYSNIGLLDGRIYITVFDETGRPVNRVQDFDVSTQKTYFGIKLSDYYNNTRQPMQIEFAATDSKGNATNSPASKIQIIRVYWETVMERTYGSSYRYVSQKQERVLVEKQIPINKEGSSFTFTPQESGEYLVRIQDPQSTTYVESEFYAYGWGYTQNNSFEVNNEGQVEMEFDKENYEPGEKAKVLLKTPFAGKLLITIERNKVFEYFYIQTDKRSASIEIPIKEEYLPNVYITATLFRPLDEGIIPVTIAHGFAPLPVTKKSNRLPVEIQVVEKSRSNTKQTIKIKTLAKSDIEVTVAVVDEGIMQLKNSKSPDAHEFFYQKRALEVDAFDIYPYVLADIKTRKSSTGGDGYDLQKRVNPLTNKRVKLVSYWSGILKTDGNGVATCSVDIPQFSGDLRVMAVAYKDKAFGNAEKHIKVADPIIISPSMPRFLSPGDTLSLPVTISNTTGKQQNLSVALENTGPLTITGVSTQNLKVEANQEARPIFKIAVQKQIGEGSVTIKVNNGSETFTDKTDITVRPPASLQKISGSGEITSGATADISTENKFIESSKSGKLIVSRSPIVQFSDQLSYLLGYPYGCVEQTISTAFPQIYYSNLVKAISNNPGQVIQISMNIQAAIGKLQSMQQYNGSMSYWPGGNEESWWGSAYAFHFLNEAKKAGYEVPQETLNKLSNYLSLKVKQHPLEDYYYTDINGKTIRKNIPAKDIFYSLYLLSLYSKADMATMNYYRSKTTEMALDSRYLLAASYLACGDRNAYTDLLPSLFKGEASLRSTGGNFYSYVRDEALALNALLETDPSNSQIGSMVRHLSQQIKNEKYLSTQERAFAFLSLGKFMKTAGASNATATITANGKVIGEFKGEDLSITKGITGGDVKIKSSGNGKLYYFWEMEGLTTDGSFIQEDSYLQVRKSYFNRFGQPVSSLRDIKQNDLIVVKISLVNSQRNLVENVVLSDILPAGLEIENPRISAVPELSWIKDNSVPTHMDIRDDRINYFTDIDEKPKSFYYLARAVSTGKFVMGPVSADAMYDGSYHSYHGAGVIEIK